MAALIQPPILVDQVYEKLISAISEQRLRPGERIRQGKLATSLGVSRQPVSHALQLLKRQGLLRTSGKQGLEVTPLDPDRLRHLYKVRSSLDALAARLAAMRMAAGDLTLEEQNGLARIRDEQPDSEFRTRAAPSCQEDVDFHHAIYHLSGNPVIQELIGPQWPHLRRSMAIFLEDADCAAKVARDHREIAELILAGDADGAACMAQRHAIRGGEFAVARLCNR